jgi:hypothetical protein
MHVKLKVTLALASALIGAFSAIGLTHTAIGKAAVAAVADVVSTEAQACPGGNGGGKGKGKDR